MALTLQDLLKKVRAIDIAAHQKSNQLLKGDYHSAFQGTGMNFREVRNYQYGDDVRNIDWNVSARMQETHVKIFEEERERCLILIIDLSGSNQLGSRLQNKQDRIAELTAVLAFSALANGDKVGAIFFSDKINKYIPPKKGKQQILYILKYLVEHQELPSSSTQLAIALDFLLKTQQRKSICFILSDFISKDYATSLKAASFKHAITGLHIYDAIEKELPNLGLIQVQDLETKQTTWIDTSSKSTTASITQKFLLHQTHASQLFAKNNAAWLSINTEEDYIKSLHLFFKKKQ